MQHERAASERHAVRADERERLLRRQLDRRKPGPPERFVARHQLAADLGAADPDQHLADVGHLREVALADRPDRANDGLHARVEGIHEQLDQLAADAHAGFGHAVRARHHHRPHHLARQQPAVGRGLVGHGREGEARRAGRRGSGSGRRSRARCSGRRRPRRSRARARPRPAQGGRNGAPPRRSSRAPASGRRRRPRPPSARRRSARRYSH